MIKYNLKCKCGETFESWFLSSEEYDLLSKKKKDEVLKDMADGKKYGVSGTPGFFINGWFIKGAYPFSEFEKFI